MVRTFGHLIEYFPVFDVINDEINSYMTKKFFVFISVIEPSQGINFTNTAYQPALWKLYVERVFICKFEKAVSAEEMSMNETRNY